MFKEQIHSNIVVDTNRQGDFFNQGDGFISGKLDSVFAVRLADCNGIAILGKNCFSILHAGWKGLKNGIIQNALIGMMNYDESIKNLLVYVSPSIRKCCYEVQNDFLINFSDEYFSKSSNAIYFNMVNYIVDTFIQNGLLKEKIIINQNCTKCSGKYFSYRNGDLLSRNIFGIEKIC